MLSHMDFQIVYDIYNMLEIYIFHIFILYIICISICEFSSVQNLKRPCAIKKMAQLIISFETKKQDSFFEMSKTTYFNILSDNEHLLSNLLYHIKLFYNPTPNIAFLKNIDTIGVFEF